MAIFSSLGVTAALGLVALSFLVAQYLAALRYGEVSGSDSATDG